MKEPFGKPVKRVYLVACENRNHGGLPGAISIWAGDKMDYSVSENVKHLESYEIETKDSALKVVQAFRKTMKEQGESVDFVDFESDDVDLTHACITYAAHNNWENDRKKADKDNNARRAKIWKAFAKWIKEYKACQETNHGRIH